MDNIVRYSLIVITLSVAIACKKDEPAVVAEYDDTPYSLDIVNGNLPAPNLPEDNPLTVQKAHRAVPAKGQFVSSAFQILPGLVMPPKDLGPHI